MWQRSKDHLETAGETYFEHMRFALVVGFVTAGAALACIIHPLEHELAALLESGPGTSEARARRYV